MHARLLATLTVMALFGAGCGCGKPGPGPVDDAGFDAGLDAGVDAGEADAGTGDAGEVDAGPPPELRILKVLPPRGAAAGGTPVTLEGTGFIRGFSTSGSAAKRATTITIGDNPVIDFQIIDDGTLELRTPPGVAGPATVTVINPLGTFRCNSCFTFYDELVVTKFAPESAPLRGGTEVTIDGAGFTEDLQVNFGVYSSPKVTFVSSKQVKAVVPRGAAVGLVDLTLYNKNGVSSQRRAFAYVADLRITQATPPTLPLSGGQVLFTGAGFTGTTQVKFGGASATAVTVEGDGQLRATAPAATMPGLVTVTVTTPIDSLEWKGIAYVSPGQPLGLLGVVPRVAGPGEQVLLLGQGLDSGALSVSIGGVAATVGARTYSTAVLTVPARGAAPRKADVVATSGGTSTLTQGFTFRLTVSGITPATGPAAGGTMVRVTGTGLPPDAQVVVGSLPGTRGATANPETEVQVATPLGSGGAAVDVVVREPNEPDNVAVLPAAFTFEEKLAVGRVQPDRGAVAGGTLVTVLGAGFGEGTVVSIGPRKAKDVKVVDSHTLTCRTPRGELGVADVVVERLAQKDDLPGGFAYFDPRSISGGLSGGPLVGTLNVTVLDSTQGFYGAPVPQATVMLGVDPATPFQGTTDARGQITFSDPALVKAQTVTAFLKGYETATVTNVNAENLTVFIARTGGGEGNPGTPPPGPPASVISGRVSGLKAPRILVSGETLEARVFVTNTSLFQGPPLGGLPNKSQEKWKVVKEDGEYLVYTGAGLRAVYAILGIANQGANSFTPFAMGIRRGITTSPDQPATGQDIIIDQHLDVTVPITIDGALTQAGPMGLEGQNNSVYAWLDLGAEGFVPNPNNWGTGTAMQSSVGGRQSTFQFPNFPRLDGSNFIFLNESTPATFYPASYYFRRQPGALTPGVTIGPMLVPPAIVQPIGGVFTGLLKWDLGGGPPADIHNVQIIKQTLAGQVTVWSVVLPGTETQVALPPPAVQKLKLEEAGQTLLLVIYSSRSPKFAYNQWTYDSLSGVTWSSFTIALSESFTP